MRVTTASTRCWPTRGPTSPGSRSPPEGVVVRLQRGAGDSSAFLSPLTAHSRLLTMTQRRRLLARVRDRQFDPDGARPRLDASPIATRTTFLVRIHTQVGWAEAYRGLAMTIRRTVGLKILLATLTVLSMAASGGLLIFTFLPLAIGMWWAVRHSGRIEAVGWIGLLSLAGAEWAWAITYPVTEGDWPSAVIIAAIGGLATGVLLTLGRHYRLIRDVPHRSRASTGPAG